MGSGNVALVRSIVAAWERGDFDSIEWADPQIEWMIVDGPAAGTWSGLDVAGQWREFLSAWDDFRVVAEEFRELDAERVLVLLHFCGRGKSSGVDVDQIHATGASLFELHSGKVTRQVLYLDRGRALAEFGGWLDRARHAAAPGVASG